MRVIRSRPSRLNFITLRIRAGAGWVYLCGHSLGLQPCSAASYVEEELAQWRRSGVLGHTQGTRPWIEYHEHAAPRLAALAGASVREVVAMNSLTVNLHLMMVSFFKPEGRRNCILIEKSAFPSDRYAVMSQLAYHGLDAGHLIELAPRPGEQTLRAQDVLEVLGREGPRLALVLWPGVQYLTGQLFDLGNLTAAARAAGAVVGLDLAHAIGNVPLRLHDWGADFAVWCSYKYLNAGPGAIGGCFVHERHAQRWDLPRFAGWWGHDKARRFEMAPEFHPMGGGGRMASQQSARTLRRPASGLARALRARRNDAPAGEVHRPRAEFMQRSIRERLAGAVEIITPPEAAGRGSQLSLRLSALVFLRQALPREPHRRGRHRRLAGAGHVAPRRRSALQLI